MLIIRSLTYNAYYIRGQARYKTCFNNGYIESMSNVVKLVKRNAHGFRYFDNLRKRIFLHLGCKYEFLSTNGLPLGIRTLDPLIKSQLLCQLS